MTIVQKNSRNNSLIGSTPRENKAPTTCYHRQGVMNLMMEFKIKQKNFQIRFNGGLLELRSIDTSTDMTR